MEQEFLDWFEANERRFAHGQFDDKKIAYSAWIEGRKVVNKNDLLPDVSNRRELLIGLIRKDTDVIISGQFKGRLFGYRQESFLVEYNHNGQCEWVSIDDITT